MAQLEPKRRKRLREGPGGPTVSDIARAARVSTASVSRVLNEDPGVSAELRERVEREVEALGYVRHGAARALAARRSFTVGAVVPTLESAIFAGGLEGLESRLEEEGYTLLVAVSHYDLEQETRQVRRLIERGVDGIMLVGQAHAPATYALMERAGVRHVDSWAYSADSAHPCVGFDNEAASRRIGDYLLDIGHRRIAMIAGVTRGNDRAAARLAGLRAALAARGLELPPERLIERPYAIAEGRQAMAALLAPQPRPTAVVCGNDVLAVGALLECQARGVAVPGEVSITGFDDLPLAGQLSPAITTMQVPAREMGRLAAAQLLGSLGGKPGPERQEVPVNLLVRETTAPPPAA